MPAGDRNPEKDTVKRKQRILQVATELFARKGYDGTSTLEIAKAVEITEPLIFYHFKTKEGLYTRILEDTFTAYFQRMDSLEKATGSPFEKIEGLITMHLDIADEMPDAVRLILRTIPAKLSDPDGICMEKYRKAGEKLVQFLETAIELGVAEGQFRKVDVKETANVIAALVSGLLRQWVFGLADDLEVRRAAIDFCRGSLEN